MNKLLNKTHLIIGGIIGSVVFLSFFTVRAHDDDDVEQRLRDAFDNARRYSQIIDFPNRIGPAGDPVAGQAKFGFAADGVTGDSSLGGLFEGDSLVGGHIVSNGRTCFSCHRADVRLGMPRTPISANVPADDPLITGVRADSGDEPNGPSNLENLGLVLYRPGRFNPLRDPNDPFRQVFFWRKSIKLLNTVFTFGNLNDGRTRELGETARGAIFSHTREGDARIDDIANRPCFPDFSCAQTDLKDIGAFIESKVQPAALTALLDPNDPMHDTLVNDPFHTVNATTPAEKRGQKVFEKYCYSTCHTMPNVFSNRDHTDGLPLAYPAPYGHMFDIGVAQQNFRNLEFRKFNTDTQQRETIVLPLVREDGLMIDHPVLDDVGLAASTGRYEDLHRFKVPQLRDVKNAAPYMHDDSIATLEGVIDYFTSPAYNNSADGKKFPIQLNAHEKADLLAFLNIL
jgi:hypothetical protein